MASNNCTIPGQSLLYPHVLGPKYAWTPRMPTRPQMPDGRMYSDTNRMYPMQQQQPIHPYYGSRDLQQQQQQYPLSDYLPPSHGGPVHDVMMQPSHHLGTSHSSPQLAQVTAMMERQHLTVPRFSMGGGSPAPSSAESSQHSPQLRHQVLISICMSIKLSV